MHKLPIEFSSKAEATGHFGEPWKIKAGSSETRCAIPTEFGGLAGGFSPEDLFLQALINCFLGTFKVYARGSKINFDRVHIAGRLVVDQDLSRKVVMKSAQLEISIYGVDRPDRIESIVIKTLKDGFILNSVKTEIQHTLHVYGALDNSVANSK